MNSPRDQGQRLGGISHSSIYQHGTPGSPTENSRFKRPEISNQQQQQQRANSNIQSLGPYSAPPSGAARMPDRTHTPTRASTIGSTDHLDRTKMASQSDYGHHAQSEDLNHGGSTRNTNNNYGGRDPGPSPAFMNSSRPTTPGSSGQQQQQASSSSHSEHRLSTASRSSDSDPTNKSVVPSSTSLATSIVSS
jgi:hypothetical protein